MTRKVTESSGNIFLDLGFPPHEAKLMLSRASWRTRCALRWNVSASFLAKAAKRLGLTQARVSETTRGKVELFSLDYLVGYAPTPALPPACGRQHNCVGYRRDLRRPAVERCNPNLAGSTAKDERLRFDG